MSAVDAVTLTPAATSLEARLRLAGTQRVRLGAIWHAFVAADPAHASEPEKRDRLAGLLAELAAAGRITYPSDRSWDRRPDPPLPRFVSLVATDLISRRRTSLDYPWHPSLAWAATTRLSAQQLAFCQRVNRFLVEGGASRPVVPIGERSLELCGDEKRLGDLTGTALFGPGRLTLELLRAKLIPEPLAATRIGDGPVLLVAENATTYHSLVTTLSGDGEIGVVGFGRGWQFCRSVASVGDLAPPVHRIAYFGDLDPEGLGIPRAAGAASRSLSLPEVQPAAELYRLLLEVGQAQPLRPGQRPPGEEEAQLLASWLPVALRDKVVNLLTSGHRLAQEWVGYEVLAIGRSTSC
jgi:hypothetical protein